MKFSCPHCAASLEVTDSWAGHGADCPGCQRELVVPTASPAAPTPNAAANPPATPPPPKPRPPSPGRASAPRPPRPPAPGRYTPPKPPPRRGGGFAKFLLALLLLAAAGFGFVMMRFDESPRQVWQRLADTVAALVKPTPPPAPDPVPEPAEPEPDPLPAAPTAPASEPRPDPLPEPTPPPEPVLAAEPPPPLIDAITWLLAHPRHAPREITLRDSALLSVLHDGEAVGTMTAPAGTKVQLVDFTAETVAVRVRNAIGKVLLDSTNLRELARAEQERAGRATNLATPAPRPRPAPTVAATLAADFPTPRFTSPGVIFSREDLETIKANLHREPWKSGFEALSHEARSRLTYRMAGPFKSIKRAPNENLWPWRGDMIAVWNLARMWYLTGEEAYAQKARDILIAWATTHTEFGGRESMLDLGDYAVCFVGGADLLRGTWPGWTADDTATVKKYFNDVLQPAANPYGESQYGAANKGALALVAMGMMAIFNEDVPMLRKVVYQVRTLAHIGLRSSNDLGMLGDSLRDQGHAHGQLISLAKLAEALWKQGSDIYSDYDDRLLAVGEYFARINTFTPTPFLPFGTTDAYYLADRTNHGWGGGHLALHILHGAYVLRKGIPAPYTERRIQTMPVDGGSFMFIKERDRSAATPILPPPIPATASITSGLRGIDLGGSSPAGGASYSRGVWTVRGGGRDIWRAADSSHFAYTAITGDSAIIAKVESVQNTSPSAKAGVMMRTSLDEGAPRAWMALTAGGALEQNMPNLVVYGGTNYGNKVLARPQSPYWVKLERIGNIITGYVSPDGTNWAATNVGRIDAPVPATIYVGLVVCSSSNGTPNTSTFRHVRITGGDGGAPVLAPAAPAALLASPADGAVILRWQAAFGATGYTVKRATSARGPHAIVAEGVTTRAYTDTTVTNGTTYHYVVSAVNSAGASPDSPADTATPRAPMWNVAVGGTATATVGAESAERAFDGNSHTLWHARACRGAAALQYDFGVGRSPLLRGYTVTNALFRPERDPRDWQLQGSHDGAAWTTLDTRRDQSFPLRHYEMEYALARPAAYRFFRLHITANHGDNDLQLAELKLLADAPMPNATVPARIQWKTNDATDRDRALARLKAIEAQK